MPPSTIPSTSSAISSPGRRFGSSDRRRWRNGAAQPTRHDDSLRAPVFRLECLNLTVPVGTLVPGTRNAAAGRGDFSCRFRSTRTRGCSVAAPDPDPAEGPDRPHHIDDRPRPQTRHGCAADVLKLQDQVTSRPYQVRPFRYIALRPNGVVGDHLDSAEGFRFGHRLPRSSSRARQFGRRCAVPR